LRSHRHGRQEIEEVPQTPAQLAALGFLGGMALGVLYWSRQLYRHRQALFSQSPLRRLAALGYLSAQPSQEAVRLLRDYIRWEPRSVLRRRGQQVLRKVEASLE
jgi:hypothetical protein